jgi:hypothetical protein
MGYDVWLSIGSFGSVVTWPSMITSRRFVVFGIAMFGLIGHLSGSPRDSAPEEKHSINAVIDAIAAYARRCSPGYRECSARDRNQYDVRQRGRSAPSARPRCRGQRQEALPT